MVTALTIDVFNSGYKPIPGGPEWDDRTPATWPASTSTLIAGDHEAVLVDALLTTNEGERLTSWVRQGGKRLRAILVTHGHGDHFFGAGPLLEAFPDVPLLAGDQRVVDEGRADVTPQHLALWDGWFAGQFSPSPPTPSLVDSQVLDVEGHDIVWHTIGRADAGALNTVVEVPHLRTICAGDIAYNNIHMWLRNSTPDSRRDWLQSLDDVAGLHPTTIIAGHKDPDAPDDAATRVLDQSRRYIEDFERAVADADTPTRVMDVMLDTYPTFGNRYTLFVAANSQFPS